MDNTKLSTLEIARRHVTHLDRFKYRKKTSRCQVFRYRKVKTFDRFMRKKPSYFFSAKKNARDVWNSCTASTQNCARHTQIVRTVPRVVNIGQACRCRCGPLVTRVGLYCHLSGVWLFNLGPHALYGISSSKLFLTAVAEST